MSACPSLFYPGVTPAQWAAIKSAIATHLGAGASINTDSGQETVNGYTVSWSYTLFGAAGELTIQCLDSPWWTPCSAINNYIDGQVKALTQPAV